MSSKADIRFQYVCDRIKDFVTFGDTAALDAFSLVIAPLTEPGTDEFQLLQSFLNGNKPDYLLFTYQPETADSKDKKFCVIDPTKVDPSHTLVLRAPAVYAARAPGKAINAQSINPVIQEVMMGTLSQDVIISFEKLLNDVYNPLLSKMSKWGKNSDAERVEFIQNVVKYADHMEKLRKSTDESIVLQKIAPGDMKQVKPEAAKQRGGADTKTLSSIQTVVESWIGVIEHVLADAPQYGDDTLENENIGPLDEVEIWKKRLAKLNLLVDQLTAVEAARVIAYLREAKSNTVTKWAAVDAQLSEKLSEAKENVKYLSSLEKFLNVVETGTPQTIINLLPALIGNIKMMYVIARYYANRDCMTALFFKITNQMIKQCRATVLQHKPASKIWELAQDPATLREILVNLEASKELNTAYKDEFKKAEDSLAQKRSSRDRQFDYEDKQFDFTKLKLFGHFDLFAKRVDKLQKVFQTVEQFQRLKLYNIDQMGGLIQRFNDHLSQLKSKCSDILNIHDNSQFDGAFKQFDSHMVELETSLQVTINSSFENITSTENALNLLKKFQTILQTDSFRSDLDSKYMVIFHNYGLELENDQKLYERHKADPPLVRNITPVAGAITWARQLLRHIKGPMDKFASNETVMNNPKESKKIIRTYNKVSMALVEYEAIWVDAWKRSIDSAKAGLNATLLVRNDEGKLFVNFDLEIIQLIRETRAIMRMGGIEIPPSAKMVLMQEQKLKTFLNELTFLVKEYERVVGRGGDDKSASKIIPVTRKIMQPNIDALDAVIRPGERTLTWTSMNIDSFLAKVHKAIAKLDSVVTKVNDIVTNRIQSNLKQVSSTLLVKLNDDQFTLEQFVQTQDKHILAQSQAMDIKNCEVQTAVDDVIATVLANQEPGRGETSQEAIVQLRVHFNRLMFKAILTTTTRSLNLIKKRVGTRNRIAFMYVDKPFFDVNVQLLNHEPFVNLNPSLEEVQKAINISATAVLSCSKTMTRWKEMGEEHRSFFEEIAKNKEIVKVVLLLTGGIHGLKKQVNDYLTNFKKFEYLWKKNKEQEYEEFLAKNPSLEDFEAELSKFVNLVEKELEETTPTYNIGSLSLTTDPLKQELRKKAEEWKEMYAKNLHAQALRQLDAVVQQMEEDDHQLNQPIPDQEKLEELRVMMTTLRSVRERESEIDFIFEPVREMYALLARFKVNVPKEETDRVGELSYRWQKLRRTAEKRTDEINQLQHSFKKGLTQEVQKFGTDVILFRTDYEANGPMVQGISPQEAIERLKRYQRQFEDKDRKWATYMAGEELFGLPQHKYPELARTKKELELLHKLYGLYKSVLRDVNGYNEIYWDQLEFDRIAEEVGVYENQCKKLPAALRGWDAYKELRETLENFMKLAPIIKELKHESVKDRHWKDIMKICDKQWSIAPTDFKLADIVNANMTREAIMQDVMDVAGSAVREADIERKFNLLVDEWKEKVLVFKEFKHRGPISLNSEETNTLKDLLEEAALGVNSMLSSRYCDFKREEVRGLLNKLVAVGEKLGLWMEVQNLWSYLEAVFSGGDIAKQMPNETKSFHQQDKTWVKIMTKANEGPNVLDFYENELLDNLVTVKDNLENIQRKLADYLETKRNSFPRFYFVSDTVLLEILSQASDPESIQPHLNSIFDGVTSVRFERVKPKDGQPPYMQIVELFSDADCSGESLMLQDPVACPSTVNVETWLDKLCSNMCFSVKEVVKNAVAEVNVVAQKVEHIKTLVETMPAQVLLLVLQLLWTTQVSDYITSRTKGAKVSSAETTRKIEGIKSYLVRLTTSPELEQKPRRFRTNIETLITIQVHQEEVWITPLKAVTNIQSFDWLRQARFYFKPEKEGGLCVIQIADSDTDYCNEYLGVKERLVITPLTDRCYITLSQALAMYMGGAPAGPAGTGKTETTKDLARTFGKFCVVFNCSDQLDRDAMGKIIRGLSQANAWGCFDEFNRIDLPVLSVVAQQVECVLKALKQHKSNFIFIDGQDTLLRPGVGFFITMNPGYAGRQELPENLKILFRGVTMMVPDRMAIMKVKLASQGYQTNDNLSKKFFYLYQLCEEQLSKQRHYDFGLRNILSVLRTAGAVLRANMNKPEDFLFMRTLRDMNLSKLVFEDIDLFDALLKDIFPGLVPDKMSHGDIEVEIKKLITKKGLVEWTPWYGKIIQLYETKLVRHGVMVVGPALCGKSQCYDQMTDALSVTVMPHVQLRMNPKAITAQQMFGRLVDKDWYDGIFSALWRRAVRDSKKKHNWIVCDGPVDAIWIENLNTVLDDNKLLTLANGDRIFMADNMKMCFEVENLANASPATVSRAGIIYISESILGWRAPLLARLKAKKAADGTIRPADVKMPCNPNLANKLLPLFMPKADPSAQKPEAKDDSFTTRCADFYNKECKIVMRTSTAHLVINAFHLCVALGEEAADMPISDDLAQQIFWFSIAWSFGGLLESEERIKFDGFIRTMYKKLPSLDSGTIFDHRLIVKTGEWQHWNKDLKEWTYPGNDKLEFASLFIPTLDSVRLHYLMQCNLLQNKPLLLMGVSGTAKTVTIEKFMLERSKKNEKQNYKKINFSSMTTPQNFYNAIDDLVEKMGPAYGPKGGGELTLFIDDINMPEINTWGDQVTNEIVRQVVEMHEYYSFEKGQAGNSKKLKDVHYVGAMSHPTGGKNDIPNRLKRHFTMFNVPLPDEVSIKQIFGSIFNNRFKTGYHPSVLPVADKITTMTIDFWKKIAKKMLPTPSKFHYFFNLRDLASVSQGICMVGMFMDPQRPEKRSVSNPAEVIKDASVLVQAWVHECTRVFSDKLNTKDDKIWFDREIKECARQHLKDINPELADVKAAYFVNYLRDPVIDPETEEQIEDAPKIFEPAPSLEVLQEKLMTFMAAHNETPIGRVKKLDLVLFDAAIKHVGRVLRALATPRGNILMVGVGGSGKQSLTRLATFVAGYDYAALAISKGFGVNQLFDAIREQYLIAAFKRPVSFVFTDNEIKQEVFLEYINSFLSNGEIPGLFPADQRDSAINEVRPVGKKDPMFDKVNNPFQETPDFLWKYFINRVRDRLHMVLCFSPVGDKFRGRARKFPALVSSCVINWFFPWPQEALLSVSERVINNFSMDKSTDEDTKKRLKELMAAIHMMMLERSEEYKTRFRREVYSTPKSYLSFIAAYTRVYSLKQKAIDEEAEKITGGLDKLNKAGEDVRNMRTELAAQEVVLGQAKKETEALVKEIEIRTASAEEKRKEVEVVKNKVAADAAVVAQGEAEAKRDLEAAEPALLMAVQALDSITANDFTTLKKLANPPALIKRIFDGVSILLHGGLGPVGAEIVKGKLWITDSWDVSGKGLAGDARTLNVLFDFGTNKKDNINEETCELLLPYLWMEDFTREKAASACGNVAGLCTWVRAMYSYINIAKVVGPKKEKLRVMQNELRVANKKKEIQEEELAKVAAEVEAFNKQFQAENAKKIALEEKADATKKKMESATNLIEALSGERERWNQQRNEFKDILRKLVGDVALACAFISYCGPFNSEFRHQLLYTNFTGKCKSLKIPMTESMNIVKFLADETTVADWQLEGLPADDHSVQNAIMITSSDKWPLMIDPQGQALTWLKRRTDKQEPPDQPAKWVGPNKVVQITDKTFLISLNEQLGNGKPLIIENLTSEIDPMLDPLLEKQYVKQGTKFGIKINDQDMAYDKKFTLYMTTKLPNPTFSPELFAKCLVIDFTVTQGGLEQQLLSQVIGKEKSELNEENARLSEEINTNEKRRKELEDELLLRLSMSEGDLIEDVTLIETLAKTKSTSKEIKEKLEGALETKKRITGACEEYRPVATRGSVLYFLIVEMSAVNPMYQTSLPQFNSIFDGAIDKADRPQLTSKRIQAIIDLCTYMCFQYIVRGLFSSHKLLFVLLMACKIELKAKRLDPAAFDAFLKGQAALATGTDKVGPFKWMKEKSWLNLLVVTEQSPKNFKSLTEVITRNEIAWKTWYEKEALETEPVPDLNEKLEPFDHLLLIRALREDRAMLAATKYVAATLGPRFAEPQQLDMTSVIEETKGTIPVIFLLSQGSDPTTTIEAAAKKLKKKVQSISMGQGQEKPARQMVLHSWNTGDWALLQNCHLGLPFLDQLEEMLRELLADSAALAAVHEESRVWITAEPHNKFPIGLLQMSVKLTNEPPQGIRAGIIRSYSWLSQDHLETFRRYEWRPLLFTQCIIHSIVQERRKFGPMGFCVPYEFNQGDWQASVNFLTAHLTSIGEDTKKGQVSWETIQYMVAEIQYGGRITDNKDRKLFLEIVKHFHPRICEPTFTYAKGNNFRYGIPQSDDYKKHLEFIREEYPDVDPPEVFGMAGNADITYRTRQAQEVLSTILDIQPRGATQTGGQTREEKVLAVTDAFLQQLPSSWNPDKKERLNKEPLSIFCGQEIDRLMVTIKVIRQTCIDLKLAVAGTIIMSPKLSDALDFVGDGRVPPDWAAVSWPSPIAVAIWFGEVKRRYEQLDSWVKNGRPQFYWFNGFFNPQGFLTSVRQEITRTPRQGVTWALDKVETRTEVRAAEYRHGTTEKESDPPEAKGVFIYGLYIDGASWSKANRRLIDAPSGELFRELPIMCVYAGLIGETGEPKGKKGPGKFRCPVYKYPKRTDNFWIFDVDLVSEPLKDGTDPDHYWRMRGVCLLCSID